MVFVSSFPRIRAGVAGGLLAAGLVGAATATDFCEGPTDSGGLPMTARMTGGNVGPLTGVNGMLTGTPAHGDPDFEDMYLIYIVDPALFEATVAGVDAQLWLFQGPGPTEGFGLLASDGSDPGGALLTSMSNDGSGSMVNQPGEYYLAISGRDVILPGDGRIPVSSTGDPLFNFMDVGEISGPDGTGGMNPIADWNGNGQIFAYEIDLEGCGFICPADVVEDRVVDTADLLAVIAAWGCAGCPEDIDGDGTVSFVDLLTVLKAWGPC